MYSLNFVLILNVNIFSFQIKLYRNCKNVKTISKGDILSEGKNFDILRPGNRIRGLDAKFLDIVNGKKVTKDILIGDGILDYE